MCGNCVMTGMMTQRKNDALCAAVRDYYMVSLITCSHAGVRAILP
ncbi:MAG: hypothetical protein RLZZ508_699, partial [Actinomycetota bacterium]